MARRAAILVVLVVVLVQPGFGTMATPTLSKDVDVLVVVDRTRSMAALDHEGRPRITGAEEDLTALADTLPGARFALLTFGDDATLELPFTSDTATFTTAVETLRLEGPFDGTGSRVDRPVDAMRTVLERADDQHPGRRRIVVFVSDGEDTGGESDLQQYGDLEDLVDGGVVLGYGSDEGARMPAADDLSDAEGYLYDQATGEDAISRIDEGNLETIAEQLDVDYQHRTRPGGMDAVAAGFEAADVASDEGAPAKHDLTWVFGLLLLGLVLVELRSWWRALWLSHRALQPAPEEVAP
jgi:Ca-activated chloride channel family protein